MMRLVLYYVSGGTYASLSPTKRKEMATALVNVKIVTPVIAITLP